MNTTNTPPEVKSLPNLGHMLEFRSATVGLFARNQMKEILSLLFRDNHLELIDPDPGPNPKAVGVVSPELPCLARYRRRKRSLGLG